MKKVLAILLALMLALSAFALAEGEGEPEPASEADIIVIDGSEQTTKPEVIEKDSTTSIVVQDGGSLEYTGDVTDNGVEDAAVSAEDDSTIVITGNVKETGTCNDSWVVTAVSGSEIEITGTSDAAAAVDAIGAHVVIAANEDSSVTINGDVSAADSEAVKSVATTYALDNSTITINGSLSVTGTHADSVDGDGVSFDAAMLLALNSTIAVTGDVNVDSNDTMAIVVGPTESEDASKSIVIIDGTLSVKGEDTVVFGALESELCAMDEMVDVYVTTVELGEGVSWTGDDEKIDEDTNKTYKELVLEAVNYIIHADENVKVQIIYDGGMLDGAHSATVNGSDIYYANLNEKLLLTVKDGYTLDKANLNLVDNGDGTYTLTVTENGNLIFKATITKTTSAKKVTLAQKIVNGVFGNVLTDVNDEKIAFTAAQKDGEMTLTYTEETACHLHVTAKLAKALVNNGAKKLTVKMGKNTFTYAGEDLAKVLEDETLEEVLSEIDDEAATAIAYTVAGEEKTDVSETLIAEIEAIEQAA